MIVACTICSKEKHVKPSIARYYKVFFCNGVCRGQWIAARNSTLKPAKKHGMDGTRFCTIYRNMKARCTNVSDAAYSRYGGRGIKTAWLSFEDFSGDMYASYQDHVTTHGEKNTTLDRIDNDGDYSKENCRWATYKVQNNNRRDNHIVEYDGQKLTLTQLAESHGIHRRTLHDRLERGIPIHTALTAPIN